MQLALATFDEQEAIDLVSEATGIPSNDPRFQAIFDWRIHEMAPGVFVEREEFFLEGPSKEVRIDVC